jgi:hypothetical protein
VKLDSTDSMPAPVGRRRILLGMFLAGAFAYQWSVSSAGEPSALRAPAPAPRHDARAAEVAPTGAFEQLLRADPIAALEQARSRHSRTIRDYTCTFVKQERLDRGLSAEQEISVKFRQDPYCIMMHWVRNPGKAVRVVYVAGRWVDENAARPEERELAVCQPGAIARLFVKSVLEPIRGARAREASRRFIDEFGFLKGLDLMIDFSRLARQRGELERLELTHESRFDGRPTWVLERSIRAAAAESDYPDAAAVYHIDQEWLVPVMIESFADRRRTRLLGRYEYRDVRMNPGVTGADFDPATYGM